MILLTQPNLIFLKPRKVAGTSFEIALSKFANEDSIITPISPEDEYTRKALGFRGPQNYQSNHTLSPAGMNHIFHQDNIVSLNERKFWNHIPAANIRLNIGEATWKKFMKISIVRNPFDMAISFYFWELRNQNNYNWSPKSFELWCLNNSQKLTLNLQQYFIENEAIIDFYIRYEHFKEDILKFETLFGELKGLYQIFETLTAKSKFRPKNAVTENLFKESPRAKNLIYSLCDFEISKFGYLCP